MKLLYTGNSPYARRVRITLLEAGLADRVEEVVVKDLSEVADYGPGGKVPLLVTGSGAPLCETLIITRYLNDLADAGLLPEDAGILEETLVVESIASVLMDSLFARSLESNQREADKRSAKITEREIARSTRCYDALESMLTNQSTDQPTLADIAVVSALGYADWRAPEDDWRSGRANLQAYYEQWMKRSSFAATAPKF